MTSDRLADPTRLPLPAILLPVTLLLATFLLAALPAAPLPAARAIAQEPGSSGATSQAAEDTTAWQIRTAVLAAPEALRDGAEVRRWTGETTLEVIREGSGGLICLADRPGDGRFRVSCYHESLEPFMAKGRELRARGLQGMEYQETRWAAVEAGEVAVPDHPAMVYNLSFPTEDVDAGTDWETGGRLHAVYVPWATAEATGLPTRPAGAGPWLMWPGKPSAHVMISIPPKDGGGS